jgi:hypothetical protein
METARSNAIKEVDVFIHTQKIDILLVFENHFTETFYKNYTNIPNYITRVTNHPDGRAHALSANIIREVIKISRTSQIGNGSQSDNGYKHRRLGWKFYHLSHLMPQSHKIITKQYNAFINALGHRFLVAGDFNAKHTYRGSRLIFPICLELYQTIQEKQLEIIFTREPNHWPTDINKILDPLDFFIFKGISHNSLNIRPNLQIASDHTPIITTISTHIITHQIPPKLHNNKKTGKHSDMISKKIYDSASRRKQRKTMKRGLQNSPT